MLPESLTTPLSIYLDEEDDDLALQQVAAWFQRGQAVDIPDLLAWVQNHNGSAQRRARALSAIRAALGLPLMPGPVCRSP